MGKFNFFYAYNQSEALTSRYHLSLIEIGIPYAVPVFSFCLYWDTQNNSSQPGVAASIASAHIHTWDNWNAPETV